VLSGVLLALTLALPVSAPPGEPVPVPREARAVDTSHPDRWVGDGTAASCTSRAVVRAVAKGGIIRFRCGPGKVRIVMKQTAKVVNTTRRVVLDGRGRVTLSGGGKRRILYQDTCDKRQIWTTSHCDDQATPRLTVQNLTFANGDSTGETYEGGGGGAIFVRGGRLKIVRSRFSGNRCDATGPDLGGAAVRALSQYHDQPVYVGLGPHPDADPADPRLAGDPPDDVPDDPDGEPLPETGADPAGPGGTESERGGIGLGRGGRRVDQGGQVERELDRRPAEVEVRPVQNAELDQ